MSFELFLAKRYMRGTRRTMGGSLTSVIAVGGVAVGVAALIVTLAIMTGFGEDIRNKILGAQPHLMVMGAQGVLPAGDWSTIFHDVPGVEAWTPFVMSQALARRRSVTQPVIVKGVDPDRERTVTRLHEHMSDGAWDSLKAPSAGKVPILLGKELARTLDVRVGDEIVLAAPGESLNPLSSLPSVFAFTVTGILDTGLYDYDSSLTVVSLDAAQAMFQTPGQYTGLGVRLSVPEDSAGAAMRIQKNVGSAAWVRSWLAMNRNLFAALKLEKVVMFLVITLITLVAAFTIVSNLLLVTTQRVHEIGILRAMGARRGSIQRIFLYKGLLMGAVGTALGLALGLGISLALKRYQFLQLPADVYYVDRLPIKIVPGDVAMVLGAALAIVLLATVYPARLAAKLDALSAIRNQ